MGFSSRRKRRRDAPRNGRAEAAIERFIYEIRRIRALASDDGCRAAPNTTDDPSGDKASGEGNGNPENQA